MYLQLLTVPRSRCKLGTCLFSWVKQDWAESVSGGEIQELLELLTLVVTVISDPSAPSLCSLHLGVTSLICKPSGSVFVTPDWWEFHAQAFSWRPSVYPLPLPWAVGCPTGNRSLLNLFLMQLFSCKWVFLSYWLDLKMTCIHLECSTETTYF